MVLAFYADTSQGPYDAISTYAIEKRLDIDTSEERPVPMFMKCGDVTAWQKVMHESVELECFFYPVFDVVAGLTPASARNKYRLPVPEI
jgi:hypothetical protein